jgi:hypothetical protein
MSLRWRQISASLSVLARAGELIELRGDFRCWHEPDLQQHPQFGRYRG